MVAATEPMEVVHPEAIVALHGMATALGYNLTPRDGGGGGGDDEISCRVCFIRPRQICLKPCKHVVLCEQCFTHPTIRNRRACPVCRTPWQSFDRVHL